jgi:hypothetical protein
MRRSRTLLTVATGEELEGSERGASNLTARTRCGSKFSRRQLLEAVLTAAKDLRRIRPDALSTPRVPHRPSPLRLCVPCLMQASLGSPAPAGKTSGLSHRTTVRARSCPSPTMPIVRSRCWCEASTLIHNDRSQCHGCLPLPCFHWRAFRKGCRADRSYCSHEPCALLSLVRVSCPAPCIWPRPLVGRTAVNA